MGKQSIARNPKRGGRSLPKKLKSAKKSSSEKKSVADIKTAHTSPASSILDSPPADLRDPDEAWTDAVWEYTGIEIVGLGLGSDNEEVGYASRMGYANKKNTWCPMKCPFVIPDPSQPISTSLPSFLQTQEYRVNMAESVRLGLWEAEGIHPIFRQGAFSRRYLEDVWDTMPAWYDPRETVNDLLYQRLKPSLRLATRLMLYTQDFFTKILFAKRIVTSWGVVFDPSFQPTDELRQAFRDYLGQIGDLMFFTGDDLNYDVANTSLARRAVADALAFTDARHVLFHQRPLVAVGIQISFRLVRFLLDPLYDSYYQDRTDPVHLLIGSVLCHELAHAIYKLRGATDRQLDLPERAFDEPQVDNEQLPELGLQWEVSTFGGFLTGKAGVYSTTGVPRYLGNVAISRFGTLDPSHEYDTVPAEVMAAFLERHGECWKLLPYLKSKRFGPLHEQTGLIKLMDAAVFMRKFHKKHGRYPKLGEEDFWGFLEALPKSPLKSPRLWFNLWSPTGSSPLLNPPIQVAVVQDLEAERNQARANSLRAVRQRLLVRKKERDNAAKARRNRWTRQG